MNALKIEGLEKLRDSLADVIIEDSDGQPLETTVAVATVWSYMQPMSETGSILVPLVRLDDVDAPKEMKARIDDAVPTIGFALIATTCLFGALMKSAIATGVSAASFFVLASLIINAFALYRAARVGRTMIMLRAGLDRAVSLPPQPTMQPMTPEVTSKDMP